MRQAEVFIHGIPAGLLTERDDGEYIFSYYDTYAADSSNPPVSLTMPIDDIEFYSSHLFPFFSNMISEGENRLIQARIHNIDPQDDFGILLATAGVDTIGAVTVIPISK